MRGLGFGVKNRRYSPGVAAPLAGFAGNGAANATVKAMLARVANGTGRGRIVWKGDSTTAGQGGGTTADSFRLTNARPNRVSAVFAALMSSAGYPTLDNAMVGDHNLAASTGVALAAYDPRFVSGDGNFQAQQDFAGGAFRNPGTIADSFTPNVAVDRFEVVIYNSNSYTLTFLIDGAAPASIALAGSTGSPAAIVTGNTVSVATPGTGYTRLVIAAATAAPHSLSWTANGINLAAIRSVMGYASTTRAIDQLVHAALGARADQQSKDNSGGNLWGGLDALVFDAPDLTIINCGLNEMAQGASVATYQAALQAMVTRAKTSGDALLVFPYPAATPYNNGVAAFKAAAAGVASGSGISFMSLYDYYGGVVDTARFSDAVVHGNAAFYGEVAAVLKRAVMAMAA